MPALILINLVAFGIGLAIRHNIKYFDPDRRGMMRRWGFLGVLGRLASAALGVAYIVSVAFYVSLLTAFALESLGLYQPGRVRVASTAILVFIAAYGYLRGLHGLEALEKIAVNLKMSIIGGLLLVLAVHAVRSGPGPDYGLPQLGVHSLQLLGGMLLITQGFETTKYLGHQYTVRPRVRALLLSQAIAAVVYVAFVGLVAPLVAGVDASRETAIIAVIARLSAGLGVALSLGAIFSQFSAAVADTVGTGGIAEQETGGRISERVTYVVVAAAGILVLWTRDIFSVMALASRAFAAYYAIQCLIATLIALLARPDSPKRTLKLVAFPLLGVLLLLVAVFAIPAE